MIPVPLVQAQLAVLNTTRIHSSLPPARGSLPDNNFPCLFASSISAPTSLVQHHVRVVRAFAFAAAITASEGEGMGVAFVSPSCSGDRGPLQCLSTLHWWRLGFISATCVNCESFSSCVFGRPSGRQFLLEIRGIAACSSCQWSQSLRKVSQPISTPNMRIFARVTLRVAATKVAGSLVEAPPVQS